MGKRRTVHTGMGHWGVSGETPQPDDNYGFIYMVTNKVTGAYYIGKKAYIKPLPPKKRSRKYIVRDLDSPLFREEDWTYSNWRTYTGSSGSKSWVAALKSNRGDFTFAILDQARSSKALSMLERWYIGHVSDMMLDPLCENLLLSKAYKVPATLRYKVTERSRQTLEKVKEQIKDANRSVYHWKHPDGTELQCTKVELLRKYPDLAGWTHSNSKERVARKKRTAIHKRTTLTMTVQQWADRLGLSYSRASYVLTHGSVKHKLKPLNSN